MDGMWLAVSDGLMLPLLIIDLLILFVFLFANKLLNFHVLSAWYPALKDSMALNLPHFLVWLLVTTAAVVGCDHAIIHRVWRAVNAPPTGSRTPGGGRRKVHMAVATIIILTFVIIAPVAGYRHANKADYVGRVYFPEGDFIKLYSVQRSKDRMVVTGAYHLVSHDNATLALFITTTNNMGVPTGTQQEMGITNGWGNFELIENNPAPGLPHVSMYADNTHEPFASLYFGTRAEAFEERRSALITNAAAGRTTPAEAAIIRQQVEQQANDASNVDTQTEIRIRFDQSMNPNDLDLNGPKAAFNRTAGRATNPTAMNSSFQCGCRRAGQTNWGSICMPAPLEDFAPRTQTPPRNIAGILSPDH